MESGCGQSFNGYRDSVTVLHRAGRGAPRGPDGTDQASAYVLSASADQHQPVTLASMTGLDNASSLAADGEHGVRWERGLGECAKRETLPK